MIEYTEEEKQILEELKGKTGPPPELPYEKQLVAFIDILGVKEKIKKSGPEAIVIMTLMEKIRKHVETLAHKYIDYKEIRILQIGDGFFLVTNFNRINEMCMVLAEIQWQVLIDCHWLIRGALTAGNVSVGPENSFFIGQAILEVIELERKNAIFPRIICEIHKIEKYVGKGKIDDRLVTNDRDKIIYIDYIGYNIANDGLTQESLEKLLANNAVDSTLRKEYEDLVRVNKGAAQKYGWLFSRFEDYKINMLA